ncbi:MAG: HD domain-containing protein [Minisyncoccia bacterium]
MNIQEIYKKYDIFTALQLHQLRVAGVAQQLCESLDCDVQQNVVVAVCLMHDMGNVLKLDFSKFPEFFEPEGVDYWKSVKEKYIQRYGTDEHHATAMIVHEIIGSKAYDIYLNSYGHTHAVALREKSSIEEKICAYADMRVAPRGVVSMLERYSEMCARYKNHPTVHLGTDEELRVQWEALCDIESELFAHARITPEQITESSVSQYWDSLKKTNITYD